MSSTEQTETIYIKDVDFAKLRKDKKCACIIVGSCLFGGLIFLTLSYGGFEDSKFYGAPTDTCMFTNASLAAFDCRTEMGCNGLQTRFHYNTTGGTCDDNVLYDYSECDCDDDPIKLPKANASANGYQTADKCWILSCESNEEWTFIEPVNERVQGWICGIIGTMITVFGLFNCCKCLQSDLAEGTALIDDIGEKEAYARFYQKVLLKNKTDIPQKWRVLHIIVITSSIATPIILIGAFLNATISKGKNITDHTISEGIGYNRNQNGIFRFTEAMTMLAVVLASFVSWCRQIQIAVYFKEYATFFGPKQAKIYRWLNVLAMIFNVVGYFGILQLVSYDAERYGGDDPVHGIWAMIAFLSTGAFLLITTIITFKQKQVEYRRNRMNDESVCVALQNTFWLDAVLMLILFIVGATSLFVFFAEIAHASKVRSNVPEEEQLNTFSYIRVFTGEWIAFFSFVSGIAVLALNFHHDHIAWEIHYYLKHEVPSWPCADCVFTCLDTCCCYCCDLSVLDEDDIDQNTVKTEKTGDDEKKETDHELVIKTENDDTKENDHELVIETENDNNNT